MGQKQRFRQYGIYFKVRARHFNLRQNNLLLHDQYNNLFLSELKKSVRQENPQDEKQLDELIQECLQRQVVNNANLTAIKTSKFISNSPRTNQPSIDFSSTDDSSEFSDLDQDLRNFTKETDTFEVIEKIGSGGFGIVVKAKNKNIQDQVYAVKRVPLENEISDRNRRTNLKIIREAELLRSVFKIKFVQVYNNTLCILLLPLVSNQMKTVCPFAYKD